MPAILPPPPPPPKFENKYKIGRNKSKKGNISFPAKIKRAYDFQADQKLSSYWKSEFAKLVEEPTYKGKFNTFAWFFGVFWLLSKGMWKNAIGFVFAVGLVERFLDAIFGDSIPSIAGIGINYGFAAIFGQYATRLYFIKKVTGNEPFFKLFKSKKFWDPDIRVFFGVSNLKDQYGVKVANIQEAKSVDNDQPTHPLAYLILIGLSAIVIACLIPFESNTIYSDFLNTSNRTKQLIGFFSFALLPLALAGLFFSKISRNYKRWTYFAIGLSGSLFLGYFFIVYPKVLTGFILSSCICLLIGSFGFKWEKSSESDDKKIRFNLREIKKAHVLGAVLMFFGLLFLGYFFFQFKKYEGLSYINGNYWSYEQAKEETFTGAMNSCKQLGLTLPRVDDFLQKDTHIPIAEFKSNGKLKVFWTVDSEILYSAKYNKLFLYSENYTNPIFINFDPPFYSDKIGMRLSAELNVSYIEKPYFADVRCILQEEPLSLSSTPVILVLVFLSSLFLFLIFYFGLIKYNILNLNLVNFRYLISAESIKTRMKNISLLKGNKRMILIVISLSLIVITIGGLFYYLTKPSDRITIGKDFAMTWEDFNQEKECSHESGGIWTKEGECEENFQNCHPGTCTQGNCVNGYGKMTFPSGGFFLGEFKDGDFNGTHNITMFCPHKNVLYGGVSKSSLHGLVFELVPRIDKTKSDSKCIDLIVRRYEMDTVVEEFKNVSKCFESGIGSVEFQMYGTSGNFIPKK